MSQKQVLAPIVGRTLVLPVGGTTRWERLTATVAPGIAITPGLTPVTTIKPSLMPCAVIQASPLSVVPVAWRVPPVLAAPQTPGIAEIAATSTEGLGEHIFHRIRVDMSPRFHPVFTPGTRMCARYGG